MLIASDLAGLLNMAPPAPYSLWVGRPSLDTASSGLPLLLATGVPLSSASVSKPWRNSCGTVIICSACSSHEYVNHQSQGEAMGVTQEHPGLPACSCTAITGKRCIHLCHANHEGHLDYQLAAPFKKHGSEGRLQDRTVC